MKTTTCNGMETVEYDLDVDTEDIEITAPTVSELADQWERLCDAFAAGEMCPSCVHYEAIWNFRTRRRERECSALDPSHCPAVNPRSLAGAFPRQAS